VTPLSDSRKYRVATNSYVADRAYRDFFAGHTAVPVYAVNGKDTTLDRLMEDSLRRIAAANAANLLASFDTPRWRGADFT
jgi:hypothetical protein